MTDLATDLCLTAIDKISYLREQMKNAVAKLDAEHPARIVLDRALAETDPGTMKEWQPGEQPF